MHRADDASFIRRVIADEHGDFAFTALPAGEYAFSVSKAGYLTGDVQPAPACTARPDTVPLRDGERRLDLTITMRKARRRHRRRDRRESARP